MQQLTADMSNKLQTGEYHIERLSIDNLVDVDKLHTEIYGRPAQRDYFKKYDTTFTPAKYIGFIAYNHDKLPIAFYGVIPCLIKFDHKIMLTAQSADTMTHPGYRNRGLFVELATLTFQLCHDSGINLIFGFPNQNSLPGFINKLGWKMTERLDCFIVNGAMFSWGRFFYKSSALRDAYTIYQQNVLKKYLLPQQGIANSMCNDGYSGVYRDHHYRKYKTYTDTHVIKIDSSTLWIKVSSMLLIGDISVSPNNFKDMMNKLKKLARKMGLKEIHFHVSPGTTLHNLFAADFHPIPSFPVIFKDLAGDAPIDKIKFTSADIDTF